VTGLSETNLTQDQEIRIEALRLAILQKEKNGSRCNMHWLAAKFSDFIKSGKEFSID
jgi:hypothetical protein